jgi:NADPH-dependent F420 reductase
MNVAIIGAGNVGRALAYSCARAGHRVRISSRGPEDAIEAAEESGAKPAKSNLDAIELADVVICAVPYAMLSEVADELRDFIGDRPIVDPTNPLRPDYSGLATEGTSAAEQFRKKIHSDRVVKAFNTLFASRMKEPVVDGVPLDGFVAADDDVAKKKVLELVKSIGLRPVDTGPLSMARYLEALAFLNISLQLRHGWMWQTGWKLMGPTSEAKRQAA